MVEIQRKNEEFSCIWISIWIAAAAEGGCHGDDVSIAAGCQVGDDVIMISTGVSDPILPLSLFSPSSQTTTNAVDQAALGAFWNGLTSAGSIGWNTTSSLCRQTGVTCTLAGKVTSL